jgi:hypothetical protein
MISFRAAHGLKTGPDATEYYSVWRESREQLAERGPHRSR